MACIFDVFKYLKNKNLKNCFFYGKLQENKGVEKPSYEPSHAVDIICFVRKLKQESHLLMK
ncbi:MAG: hypothetical protein MR432_00680 [Prevotellaceae bacterium]|nr:hypothetical protein [Bacteroidaceae bacterium]MCI6518080.1 hypothetical protein [Prevotellaceae bacterium]